MRELVHRADHLTFRGNLGPTRHGWLRLTPAYSVLLVRGVLASRAPEGAVVLDPFCGTGTTALVCSEEGVACHTTDINPFLLWLSRVKTDRYQERDIAELQCGSEGVLSAMRRKTAPAFAPALHRIERWWSQDDLLALGRAMAHIVADEKAGSRRAVNLLKLAFCRTMITHARVSFGHQSMSFRRQPRAESVQEPTVAETWTAAVEALAAAAEQDLRRRPRVLLCDARSLSSSLQHGFYTCVITSPPYPNRMSYIRELRPYMYWLGYLTDGRQAGELDWKAIGGTWGRATSEVSRWAARGGERVAFRGFDALIARIARRSDLLARYVHKYFHDMTLHCQSLFTVVRPGGTVHYIVGNSKFYDVLVPVERIYASMFRNAGFSGVRVEVLRKRTSKKELFEYLVSARKPI